MINHLKLSVGLFAAIGLAASAQANEPLAKLDCNAGDMTYTVSVNPFTSSIALVNVSVSEMTDQNLARDFALNKIDPPAGAVIAYSGVDKFDGQITMTTDANQNTRLRFANGTILPCSVTEAMGSPVGQTSRRATEPQPLSEAEREELKKLSRVRYMRDTGYSLGAKMRSRPDKMSANIARVAKGNRVEITGKTALETEGYLWYKVRAGNRTGFMWGGDLCSAYGPIDGVYGDCRRQGIRVENMWMVIASDATSRGGYGIALSRSEAQRKAMRNCKKSSCKIVNEGQPLCHAYAASRKDGYYDGLATGRNLSRVRREAKDNCEGFASIKGTCKIKFSMCQDNLKTYQR